MNANEYRNLTEQVEKNKQDILHHFQRDEVLADFGIRIIGQLASPTELPPTAENYGDAYAVGISSPFTYYIWTRANNLSEVDYWFNFGEIAIAGPAGPRGPKGDRGPMGIGTYWKILPEMDYSLPTGTGLIVLTEDGRIFSSTSNEGWPTAWMLIANINGPQGLRGPKGDTGPQGIQGIQGPKGDTGDVGGFINIAGIVSNEYNLPDPSLISNLTVAYLVGTAEPYDLYIQVGSTSDEAEWLDVGPLNVATLVTAGGQYQNTWNADTKLDKYTGPNQGGFNQAYGQTWDGKETMYKVSTYPTSGAVPTYSGGGGNWVITTGTPYNDNHCANKKYVDDQTKGAYKYDSTTYTSTNEHVYLDDSLTEHWIQICATIGFTDSDGNHRTASFNPVICRTGTQGLPGLSVFGQGETDASYMSVSINFSCDDYTNADYAPLATIDYSISGGVMNDPKVHLRIIDLGPVEKV